MADFPFSFDDKKDYISFLNDLEKTIKYPCGRRVLREIFSICGTFDVTNNFNNHMEAFNNGKKNVGANILHALMDIQPYGKAFNDVLSDYWINKVHKED